MRNTGPPGSTALYPWRPVTERRCRRLAPAVLMSAGVFCLGSAASLHAQHRHEAAAPVLAPGYRVLEYDAPEPGSYRLPPLGAAGAGLVLDETGRERPLGEFFGDKFVVLSFIFTSCNDVNGCPLATFVLGQLQQRLAAERRLRDQVRMISLSFDPDFDTPQVMVPGTAGSSTATTMTGVS